MPLVTRSLKSTLEAQQIYELVDNIEAYPSFLPWCRRATVLARRETNVRAALELCYRGISCRLVTTNHHIPHREIQIELLSGPFKALTGRWRFADLAEGGCRVDFSLSYALSGGWFNKPLGSVFSVIADRFAEAFIQQAEQVYSHEHTG